MTVRDLLTRGIHQAWLAMLLLMGAALVHTSCATDGPLEKPITVDCDCLNGAVCDEAGECVCQNNFYGPRCEIACACQNGGSCDDGKDGTGACTCPADFFGARCEGVCNCAQGLACIDGSEGDGTCLCPNGEPGTDCEVEPMCDCQNGGACGADGACVCQPGFWGSKCESACACENGALCDDGKDGTGACSCQDGFHGERCESACDCGGQPCNDTTGACGECPSGSYGADCSMVCDCKNGGVCDDGKDGTGACSCQDGFHGADCGQSCACQNMAMCDDGVQGSGACACAPGTYGADCSMVCDCKNGATCDDGAMGSGACTCAPGTYGADCANQCPGGANVCSGHGDCDDGADGDGACTCTGGWSGADCSIAPVCNDPGSSVGDVMIVEVMFDAPNGDGHQEPESEYVILYNNSCGDVDLGGWEICDASGCVTLEPRMLPMGRAVALIHSTSAGGLANYGCADNAAILDLSEAFVEDAWIGNNLTNSGDKVELKNSASTTIDRLSYGSNTSIFNPSIAKGSAGNAIQREGYPWSGTLPANADASVWVDPASGGHICNISAAGTF